jgi:hypothetical protein
MKYKPNELIEAFIKLTISGQMKWTELHESEKNIIPNNMMSTSIIYHYMESDVRFLIFTGTVLAYGSNLERITTIASSYDKGIAQNAKVHLVMVSNSKNIIDDFYDIVGLDELFKIIQEKTNSVLSVLNSIISRSQGSREWK